VKLTTLASRAIIQDALWLVKLKQWGMECCVHVSSRSWGGTTQRAAAWETNKPLVIVCSLAPNIYTFWIRIAFNGVFQRYNRYAMVYLCEDSAWIWIMNMNIKYLTKWKKLNSRFCRRIKSKGRVLNCCQGQDQDQGQDSSANFRLVDLFERLKRSQEYCLHLKNTFPSCLWITVQHRNDHHF
jgi:hypothetical protein